MRIPEMGWVTTMTVGAGAVASGGGDRMSALVSAAQALDRGDWRTVGARLIHGEPSCGRRETVRLALCLRLIAAGMQKQTVGAPTQAQERLDEAYEAYIGATGRGHPGQRPRSGRSAEFVNWRIGVVLQRERAELAALRRLGLAARRGQQELVIAYVEHLVWVEFDPFSVLPGAQDAGVLGLTPQELERFGVVNRNDLCRRAGELRQFADERTGTVSPRTWQRMGGYRMIRAQALSMLAAEPPVRSRTDVPVRPRLGRQRAWEYARTWVADTATGRDG